MRRRAAALLLAAILAGSGCSVVSGHSGDAVVAVILGWSFGGGTVTVDAQRPSPCYADPVLRATIVDQALRLTVAYRKRIGELCTTGCALEPIRLTNGLPPDAGGRKVVLAEPTSPATCAPYTGGPDTVPA